MNHLEKAVLDIMEKRYKRKYVGGLKVQKLLSGYMLTLWLGNPDVKTIQIAADLESEEDFLKFIEEELISRLLARVQYFRGVMTYPEDDERSINCKN